MLYCSVGGKRVNFFWVHFDVNENKISNTCTCGYKCCAIWDKKIKLNSNLSIQLTIVFFDFFDVNGIDMDRC